jgi:hypothetical protein
MKSLSISKILLSTVVAALCGCSAGDEDQTTVEGQWGASGIASKLGGVSESLELDEATTRSIFFGGANGTRFFQGWDTYDEPMVYSGTTFLGTLKPTDLGVAKTTLSGTLTGTVSVGSKLTLYSPSPYCDFRGQKGTVASISDDYSYMTATATVAGVSGSKVTTSEMTFKSICQFVTYIFTDENERLLHVKKLTITAETGQMIETFNQLNGKKTYTNELEIIPDKQKNSNDYPSEIYVVWLNDNTTTKETYSFTIITSDGKTYQAKNSLTYKFTPSGHGYCRRQLECIDVEAGVSTGITPPTDEDVVIDNVTKE